MTGDRLPTLPESVCERAAALASVYQTVVARSTQPEQPAVTPSTDRQLAFESRLDDQQVLESAQSASNGEKFTSLWNGTISPYDSHSEADVALCCLLAFWTGGESTQIDRLFRQSGLIRPKWDEVHYADGATYGERTIERACSHVTKTYTGES
ncbi:phage NrS-1 polymerase family protein [Haloplanus aerogenes]